jgi:hypothetical protein
MNERTAVAEIVEAVQRQRKAEPPEIAERYAAWAFGALGWKEAQAFGYIVAVTRRECGPIAEAIFDLHAVGHSSQYDQHARKAKDWAYKAAADFVLAQRGPARFRAYALPWGHQAARDGLFRAMWPHIPTPGRIPRNAQFGCGERPYVRVRDHVQTKAERQIAGFRDRLRELHSEP